MATTYPYAVMDYRHGAEYLAYPTSCHRTRDTAIRAAEKAQSEDPSVQYRAVQWGAGRWVRETPAAPLSA